MGIKGVNYSKKKPLPVIPVIPEFVDRILSFVDLSSPDLSKLTLAQSLLDVYPPFVH